MNKLFTKIAGLSIGLAMAIGVGAAIGSKSSETRPVQADEESAYTITFGNNAGSATALSSTVNASTTISNGTAYVTSQPYTIDQGNNYYGGDGKNNIRLGKSGSAGGVTIALSDSGKVKATKFVVNCMVMTGSKNTGGTLSVNSMTAQTAPTSAGNLTFTYASETDITSISLASSKAVFIYSIQVYKYKAPASTPLTGITLGGAASQNAMSIGSSDLTAKTVSVTLNPTNATDQKVNIVHQSGTSGLFTVSSSATCSSGSGSFTVTGKGNTSGSETFRISGNTETSVYVDLVVTAIDDSKTYYTVTFDVDGGSASIDDMRIEKGKTFIFPSPGTKEHFSFDGWTSDAETFYNEGDTSPAVEDDIYYLASWTEDPKYTVTYSALTPGSGSFEHTNNYGGTYTLLPFSSLSGITFDSSTYRFKNYTVDEVDKNPGDTFELGEATTVNVNFEKKPNETTITTSISEYATAHSWGSSSSSGQKTITMDSSITASCNSGTHSGKYYSDGWRIYQNETGKITITAENNETLVSVTFVFTVSNTGKLSYNGSALTSNEAVSVSGSSAEFDVGNTGSATNGQVRITEISVTYSSGSTPPTPVTTYTVTYNANGGTGSMTDSNSPYNSGATVTVLENEFERNGYSFIKWNTKDDGSGTSYDADDTFEISANTTLYAQWEEEPSDVLLQWSRSGGSDSYTSGYTFSAAAESKSDYYQDGSGDVRSVSLYRTTTPIVATKPVGITITAVLGGGTAKDPLAYPVYACFVDDAGDDIANSAVVLTNKITNATGSEFTSILSPDLATSAYGVKVYHTKEANYNVRYYGFSVALNDTPTYTITYVSNGSTGTMNPTIGANPAVQECTLTREGYSFARWNTQADGEGIDYDVGTTVEADLTLYAIWEEQIAPIGADVTMEGVSSASTATVNGHAAIKCGTSNNAGSMKLALKKANITKIKVYVAAWKGEAKSINVAINNEATISASSISLTADEGVSNSSPFTLVEEESTYKFEFTISSNAPVGTEITLSATGGSNRFVVWGATNLFAETFASEFMSNLTCNNAGTSEPTYVGDYSWSTFESLYNGLDNEEKGRLHDASANQGGTQIEQAMARYDYIEGKYNPDGKNVSYKNFIGRTITPVQGGKILLTMLNKNTSATLIVVIISAISAAAIGGYFLFRRRKEQ